MKVKFLERKTIILKLITDDKFFGTEDAPLLIAGENDEALSGETTKKMSRSERRAQRNKIKTDPQSDDELGEFQTLESAERQRYEWWGAISKDKDFNGLHHSSKNLDFLHFWIIRSAFRQKLEPLRVL